MKLIMENWKRFVNEEVETEDEAAQWIADQIAPLIAAADGDNYQQALKALVDRLNSTDGMSPAVRALLLKGDADGDSSDEQVAVQMGADIPAPQLKPTQGVIDLFKSVGFNGSNAKSLQSVIDGKSNAPPILACGNGDQFFIIDGHHRWSGATVFNTQCLIPANIIVMDPLKALLVSQLSIAAHLGAGKSVPSASAKKGRSIIGPDAMSRDQVYQTLLNTVGKEMDKKSGGTFMNPKVQAVIKASGYGGGDVKGACGLIADNCAALADANSNAGPPRKIMPQFDPDKGGPKIDTVKPDWESGKLNYKVPIKE
jgi:hypothetical protein